MKVGSIYPSCQCGSVAVLSIEKEWATVRFLNTGTIKRFRKHWVTTGNIRDPYAKLLCGVACVGNISTKGKYSKLYNIWHDMINRCYNPKNKRYAAYTNVIVDDDWLIFENFYKDCQLLQNYNEDKINNGSLCLDKDCKQRFQQNKVYSKDTCIWIDKSINSSIQDSQQKKFYALSPTGDRYESYNISKFAREHGLNRKNISGVLHNKAKTTHGWKFSYEEIV